MFIAVAQYRAERELNVGTFRTLLQIFNTKADQGVMLMGDFISSFAEKMALDEQEMKSLFLKIDTGISLHFYQIPCRPRWNHLMG